MEFRWKEMVIYWEGSKGVVFDGGWGAEPIETYVQDDESWDLVMPAWLVGRRSEVVARLKANKSHVVRTDPGLAGQTVELIYR